MRYTEQYYDDMRLIMGNIPGLRQLKNKRIFITGANGLICSSIVDFLMYLSLRHEYNITVYAAGRNPARITSRFGRFMDCKHFRYVPYDALKEIDCSEHFDYMIQGAGNANPAAYVAEPVETMLANVLGINNILSYAGKYGARRVLYISSSEVYGKKQNTDLYKEDEYGYVDILSPRSCYPSAKRAAETLCASYGSEYGVDTVIVRPGHVYGAAVTGSDNRASSQFPKDVIEGRDIIMKSAGDQLRSYCYVLDCVSAILTVLLNGKMGQAYNISNPDSVSTIREIAEAFAEAGHKKVVFENPSDAELKGYNPMSNSALAADKLTGLGWKGCFDLKTGTRKTLEYMQAGEE